MQNPSAKSALLTRTRSERAPVQTMGKVAAVWSRLRLETAFLGESCGSQFYRYTCVDACISIKADASHIQMTKAFACVV